MKMGVYSAVFIDVQQFFHLNTSPPKNARIPIRVRVSEFCGACSLANSNALFPLSPVPSNKSLNSRCTPAFFFAICRSISCKEEKEEEETKGRVWSKKKKGERCSITFTYTNRVTTTRMPLLWCLNVLKHAWSLRTKYASLCTSLRCTWLHFFLGATFQ